MTTISIHGIRGHGRHGVLVEERENGQEFIVDVTIELDTGAAEVSDQVEDTVHYGEVAEVVLELICGEPVNLIETLAARIADRVLDFERVSRVMITVHKPKAPISVRFDDVSVTVSRERQA